MAAHTFGHYATKAKYAITFARYGCENRPFFQVVVATRKGRRWENDVIEQLGTFDPIPNRFNEKLVALNFDRVKHWLGRDETVVSMPALILFGYCGLLPIHPYSYINARKTRSFLEDFAKSTKAQLAPSAQDPAITAADETGEKQKKEA